MKYTENCHLPQWESGDRVLRTDFNEAMKTADEKMEEISATLAHCGNCEFSLGTYAGTGENSSPVLSFEKTPVIVFVVGRNRTLYAIKGAGAVGTASELGAFNVSVAWGEHSVQFSGDSAYTGMSVSDATYVYLALLQA